MLQIAEWLEGTTAGTLVRESIWGFPILVAVHVMGLAFSAGLVAWFDLRLLGLSMRAVPVTKVYRRLMPVAFAGFLVMFGSGALLVAGFATYASRNLYFFLKVGLLLAAGINAWVYHRVTERTIAAWDRQAIPPAPARLAGLISLAIWTLVILAGRMMAYTLYSR
ncbi:MAG: hypothetical protein AB7O32_02180 [Vicinamibacterales bacterium]